MTQKVDSKVTVENGWVKFSEVEIDPRVQRPINEGQANAIAADLNVDALGTVTVSIRADGRKILLDGQQRMNGAQRAGYDEEVNCNFYRGLTLEEEAKLFRQLNARKNVSAGALFKVAVTEGDPQALAINDLLKALDITVGGHGGFNAIASALRISEWPNGIPDLRWALDVVANTWGVEGKHLDGRVLEGLALLHHRDGALIDTAMLRRKLGGEPGGIATLIGKARLLQQLRKGRLPIAMAEAIITIYNVKLSANALPEWKR